MVTFSLQFNTFDSLCLHFTLFISNQILAGSTFCLVLCLASHSCSQMVFKAAATSGKDPGVDGDPEPECRTFIIGIFQFVSASSTSAWLTSFSPTFPNLMIRKVE